MSSAMPGNMEYEPLSISGAWLARGERHYALRLDSPWQFLSSAPLGGGFASSRRVLSLQVPPNADFSNPQQYLLDRAPAFGIPEGEPLVGLLTAVSHVNLQVCAMAESGVAVATLVTAGVSNASGPRHKNIYRPEPSSPSGISPGTINMVTLIDANLTPSALVRANTIATEAKTLAIFEQGVAAGNGSPATGTSTDTTVAAHSARGVSFQYSGSATLVGWLVAATTYEAVSNGLRAYAELMRRRAASASEQPC